jgi:hypothetical protein
MGKIVKFFPNNAADIPDNVLELAKGVYNSVFMIGYDKNGELDIRASTNVTKEQIVWMLEQFKHNLFTGRYGVEI